MTWRRLRLRVRPDEVEQACALLTSTTGSYAAAPTRFGEESVARRNVVAPTCRRAYRDVFVYVPASGATACTKRVRSRLVELRRIGMFKGAALTVAVVADEDWATSWKRFFSPQLVAPGWWVVPPWSNGVRLPRGVRALRIDPGMAFGTGQHATTQLALEMLLPRVHPGRPMLDIGCGSGILGIAAAISGARVFASDSDPIATRAARANFRRNGVKAEAISTLGDVPASFPRAPLIAANIITEVLVGLAPALADRLTAGGILVTSGIVGLGSPGLLATFARNGLEMIERRRRGEWLAFAHRRR